MRLEMATDYLETKYRDRRTDCSTKSAADRLAIYVLMRKVEEAVAEYDKTNDHLRHAPGADCIRCRLVKAMEAP